ncbi:hypothetical protein [Demequina aurantiaca]|uniref:hypothetical protein n=1 Tax=Demequina aurantiaca TaxID=676200 RepID=UPI003D340E74
MMLEVKGSKTRTYTLRSSQRVPIDPEFAKDFTLYATEGSHVTALGLFTPHLLRLISQIDRGFNIEVIEDRIVLHSARLFKLERAQQHERVIHLADTVGRGLIANAEEITSASASTSMVSQDAADSALGGKLRAQMLRTRYSVSGITLGTVAIRPPDHHADSRSVR